MVARTTALRAVHIEVALWLVKARGTGADMLVGTHEDEDALRAGVAGGAVAGSRALDVQALDAHIIARDVEEVVTVGFVGRIEERPAAQRAAHADQGDAGAQRDL